MRVLLVHPRSDSRWPSMDRYATGLGAAAPAIEFASAPAGYLDPPPPIRRLLKRYRDTAPIADRIQSASPDVVHITAEALAHHVPSRRSAPWVVTCHDLIYRHPRGGHWTSRRDQLRLRARERSMRGLGRADRVIAISNATAALLAHHGFADPANISVVYPAVAALFGEPSPVNAPVLPPRPRILSVGMAHRYKNLPLAIRMLANPGLGGVSLVRVGQRLTPELRSLAVRLGVEHRIVELGAISDDELNAVYRSCDVLLQPSFDEGFGYPVAEAMTAGLAVVCSDGGALPEVVADAGVVVPLGANDRDTVIRFGDATEALLADPARRARLTAAGRERAAAFTPFAIRPALTAVYNRARA